MTTSNFTLQQIKDRHTQVKSGADFPAYIHDLKQMGVLQYATFVTDGHTDYLGNDGYTVTALAKYDTQPIAIEYNETVFQQVLKEHQQGKSDYLTFCKQCADLGVAQWIVNLQTMTCTYYDIEHNKLLVEAIPS